MHSCSHLSVLQTGSRDGEDGAFGAAEGNGSIGADADGASVVAGCCFDAADSSDMADCSVSADSFAKVDCSVAADSFAIVDCSVAVDFFDMADCFSIALPRRSGYGIISPAPGCRGEFVCDDRASICWD